MNFLHKYKKTFFPSITDWTGNHDLEKKRADWWALPVPEFLLFSPVAYKMIIMGMLILSALACTVFGYMFWISRQYIWAVILTAIGLRIYWALFDKIRSWKYAKYMNIYDLFFREYKTK